MKQDLLLIKIGGNIIDDALQLSAFLKSFANFASPRILVHGGGKLASRLAEQLQVPQQMVEGRRITDAETLKIVTMVYAGLINKSIVAQLQAHNCNAIGLSGADANLIEAHQRTATPGAAMNYGFAGDVDKVNAGFLETLIKQGLTPVIAPITHNKQGQLLNTNADTIATELSLAMSRQFSVHLIYLFEKPGVLKDTADEDSVIEKITPASFLQLKKEGLIFSGMIPKLENAISALQNGVEKISIGRAEDLNAIITLKKGTVISHD